MVLRELLMPQEKIFFQLLEKESKNVLAGAQALSDLIQNFDRLSEMRSKIKDIEHEGEDIDFAFGSINKIKAPEVEKRIIEVERLENEADVVLNEAVAGLFKTSDAISIIKLKEIYELM